MAGSAGFVDLTGDEPEETSKQSSQVHKTRALKRDEGEARKGHGFDTTFNFESGDEALSTKFGSRGPTAAAARTHDSAQRDCSPPPVTYLNSTGGARKQEKRKRPLFNYSGNLGRFSVTSPFNKTIQSQSHLAKNITESITTRSKVFHSGAEGSYFSLSRLFLVDKVTTQTLVPPPLSSVSAINRTRKRTIEEVRVVSEETSGNKSLSETLIVPRKQIGRKGNSNWPNVNIGASINTPWKSKEGLPARMKPVVLESDEDSISISDLDLDLLPPPKKRIKRAGLSQGTRSQEAQAPYAGTTTHQQNFQRERRSRDLAPADNSTLRRAGRKAPRKSRGDKLFPSPKSRRRNKSQRISNNRRAIPSVRSKWSNGEFDGAADRSAEGSSGDMTSPDSFSPLHESAPQAMEGGAQNDGNPLHSDAPVNDSVEEDKKELGESERSESFPEMGLPQVISGILDVVEEANTDEADCGTEYGDDNDETKSTSPDPLTEDGFSAIREQDPLVDEVAQLFERSMRLKLEAADLKDGGRNSTDRADSLVDNAHKVKEEALDLLAADLVAQVEEAMYSPPENIGRSSYIDHEGSVTRQDTGSDFGAEKPADVASASGQGSPVTSQMIQNGRSNTNAVTPESEAADDIELNSISDSGSGSDSDISEPVLLDFDLQTPYVHSSRLPFSTQTYGEDIHSALIENSDKGDSSSELLTPAEAADRSHIQPSIENLHLKMAHEEKLKACKTAYELSILPSTLDKTGFGLFAGEDIPAGAEIFSKPVFAGVIEGGGRDIVCDNCYFMHKKAVVECRGYTNPQVNSDRPLYRCSGCRMVTYCDEECQLAAFKKYHYFECPIMAKNPWLRRAPDEARLALRIMARTFMQTKDEPVWTQILGLKSNMESYNRDLEGMRLIHQNVKILSVLAKFPLTTEEMTELFCRIWTNQSSMALSVGHFIGSFIDPLYAQINHDCRPNTFEPICDQGILRLRAAKEIKKGKEITVSYVDPGDDHQNRQRQLRFNWKFECCCTTCLETYADPELHTFDREKHRKLKKLFRQLTVSGAMKTLYFEQQMRSIMEEGKQPWPGNVQPVPNMMYTMAKSYRRAGMLLDSFRVNLHTALRERSDARFFLTVWEQLFITWHITVRDRQKFERSQRADKRRIKRDIVTNIEEIAEMTKRTVKEQRAKKREAGEAISDTDSEDENRADVAARLLSSRILKGDISDEETRVLSMLQKSKKRNREGQQKAIAADGDVKKGADDAAGPTTGAAGVVETLEAFEIIEPSKSSESGSKSKAKSGAAVEDVAESSRSVADGHQDINNANDDYSDTVMKDAGDDGDAEAIPAAPKQSAAAKRILSMKAGKKAGKADKLVTAKPKARVTSKQLQRRGKRSTNRQLEELVTKTLELELESDKNESSSDEEAIILTRLPKSKLVLSQVNKSRKKQSAAAKEARENQDKDGEKEKEDDKKASDNPESQASAQGKTEEAENKPSRRKVIKIREEDDTNVPLIQPGYLLAQGVECDEPVVLVQLTRGRKKEQMRLREIKTVMRGFFQHWMQEASLQYGRDSTYVHGWTYFCEEEHDMFQGVPSDTAVFRQLFHQGQTKMLNRLSIPLEYGLKL